MYRLDHSLDWVGEYVVRTYAIPDSDDRGLWMMMIVFIKTINRHTVVNTMQNILTC